MTIDEYIKSEIGSVQYDREYAIQNGWFGRKKMVARFRRVTHCYPVDFNEESGDWCFNSRLSDPFFMTVTRYNMRHLPPDVKDIFLGLNK